MIQSVSPLNTVSDTKLTIVTHLFFFCFILLFFHILSSPLSYSFFSFHILFSLFSQLPATVNDDLLNDIFVIPLVKCHPITHSENRNKSEKKWRGMKKGHENNCQAKAVASDAVSEEDSSLIHTFTFCHNKSITV